MWVHSNCQEVELFLNGVSQGRQTVKPYRHLEWKVKYAPGKLVAKGLRNGQPIEAVVETTGAPRCDTPDPRPFRACRGQRRSRRR